MLHRIRDEWGCIRWVWICHIWLRLRLSREDYADFRAWRRREHEKFDRLVDDGQLVVTGRSWFTRDPVYYPTGRLLGLQMFVLGGDEEGCYHFTLAHDPECESLCGAELVWSGLSLAFGDEKHDTCIECIETSLAMIRDAFPEELTAQQLRTFIEEAA
jgi:hypothetical protein